MNKLRLDPDRLRVESFTPDASSAQGTGTVRGHSFVTFNYQLCGSGDASRNCMETDYHWYTCGVSCVDMCHHTGPDATCVD